MKARIMVITFFALLVAVLGFAAYVRLAPSDPARWNIDPRNLVLGPPNVVIALPGRASLHMQNSSLAQLDALAEATPHTIRLAGSIDEGRITWVTRSALWGFPDYTTAQVDGPDLYIFARLRFGKSDLGVNAARLRAWQSKL